MTDDVFPSRRDALAILIAGRAGTTALLERIPARRVSTPGLGGGEWSARDLIGHLASWEAYALEAIAAWERGKRAEIDRMWLTVSTSRLNAANVEAKAAWPLAKLRRDSARTHDELLAFIGSVSDERWCTPATARARKPLGVRIGSILGGPNGPFRHDEAHHPSLRTFLEARGW